ncbi:MAG: NAD(P)/FAD-dependent oxidoreductase [Nodosilinea sp.]
MTLRHVVIVGCGVVGATLAYELSLRPDFQVTVFDQGNPAGGATGAALGVAMAVISHQVKGRNWRLREQSLGRYQTLIPELETITGQPLPRNTHGILSLCFEPAALLRWESLRAIRQGQGYRLEIWPPEQVAQRCPHLQLGGAVAGIYSPQDFQVNPTTLTQALVAAATAKGATFYFGQPVVGWGKETDVPDLPPRWATVRTLAQTIEADAVILTSGLGTTPLTQSLHQPVAIGPVLGQAVRLQLDQPLGDPDFQPVVNGNDIHLVPLGQGDYWVGATVEFPPEIVLEDSLTLQPAAERLQEVLDGAIAYCPALAQATITDRWFGLRPRPQGQSAPIIQPLAGYDNIWLATGHYRNGVLLAPATALEMVKMLSASGELGNF